MKSCAFLAALLTLGALTPSDSRAESVVRLSMGDRVRVLARSIDPRPMVGRIVYADPLQMTIALDGPDTSATRGVAWESLNSLERSEGQGSHWRRGALYGGVVGLVAMSTVIGIDDSGSNWDGGAAVAGILGGAVGGAAIGAGIGALIHSEHWESLPLNSRVGLRLGGPSTLFALGFRSSF